jgi:hypothetical protein
MGRLLNWFNDYWGFLAPWLSMMALRDSENRSIDGLRELVEKGLFKSDP